MVRPLRIEYKDALYHVTARGNEKGEIFTDDADRRRFIDILKRETERYSARLYAYVLMGNHYHLMIQTPDANLSDLMHRMQTAYTVYYNRKHERCGHLFQGRYKAIIVEKDAYLMELSRYIHLNPVRAGFAAAPELWEWSSYGEYIAERQIVKWIRREEILKYFRNHPGGKVRAYRGYVEAGAKESQSNPFGEITNQILLGGEDFVNEIKHRLKSNIIEKDRETPTLQLIGRWSNEDADDALTKISEHYGVTVAVLTAVHRPCSRSRDTAIYVFNKMSGWRLREIAERFGIGYSAVDKCARRVSVRMSNDMRFEKEINLLCSIFET